MNWLILRKPILLEVLVCFATLERDCSISFPRRLFFHLDKRKVKDDHRRLIIPAKGNGKSGLLLPRQMEACHGSLERSVAYTDSPTHPCPIQA